MSIQEIRERASGPAEFFERDVPDLHEELLDVFVELSETPVRFHVDFRALDAAYTVELTRDDTRVVDGPMIDFPIVSLHTDVTEWDVVREHTLNLLELGRELFDTRVDPSRLTALDEQILDAFESFDGVIELALNVPEVDEPLRSELILNDYEPFGEPGRFRVSLDVEALYRVARGESSPDAVMEGAEIGGDLSLAFDLGGFLMEQFPELS